MMYIYGDVGEGVIVSRFSLAKAFASNAPVRTFAPRCR